MCVCVCVCARVSVQDKSGVWHCRTRALGAPLSLSAVLRNCNLSAPSPPFLCAQQCVLPQPQLQPRPRPHPHPRPQPRPHPHPLLQPQTPSVRVLTSAQVQTPVSAAQVPRPPQSLGQAYSAALTACVTGPEPLLYTPTYHVPAAGSHGACAKQLMQPFQGAA